MLKHTVLIGFLAAGLATGAAAQDVPSDVNGCFDQSLALFKEADAAKLAEDKQGKVEELLGKMETQCDGKNFAEAGKIAKEIKTIIAN